ncbi:MAG: hypothetical protein KDD94_06335 [Calditrichaeota bacterium]|nr:hypothetical protein [Calditrichota bacterium]
MKLTILFLTLLIALSAQDKKGISDFDKARMQAKNRLSQMTNNESILQFINLNDVNDPVHGTLRIGDESFEIKEGTVTIKKEVLAKQLSNSVDAYFESKDYVDKKIRLYHVFGLVDRPVYYVIDKRYPQKVQIVLNWDNRLHNLDLDSHLEGNDFHVYYRNKKSYGVQGAKVWLNRDVVRSNSYEMITIDKPSQQEVYRYHVNKYRGPADWKRRAVQVEIYLNGQLERSLLLNENNGASGENWIVFSLNSTGGLDIIDRVE